MVRASVAGRGAPRTAVNRVRGVGLALRATLAGVAALVLAPEAAPAHVGDRVVPVYEIPTAELPDLDDLSLSDWDAIVPGPSIDLLDFSSLQVGAPGADDLAVRVWLAWHAGSQRLYLSLQSTDDVHFNAYAGGDPPNFGRADYLEFFVDGDHSGGQYACGPPDGTPEQVKRFVGSQAQRWGVIAEAPDDRLFAFEGAASPWASRPPWADARATRRGAEPTETRVELYVTLWDLLTWTGPEASLRSQLAPGRTIGLQVGVVDVDRAGSNGIRYSITSLLERPPLNCYAENFIDALLLPCDRGDCTQAPASAVAADSWGRIKAAFALRP